MGYHASQNGKYHHNRQSGEQTSRTGELQDAVAKVNEGLSLPPLAALRQDYTDTTMQQCFADTLGEDGARLLAPALQELLIYSHEYLRTLENRVPGLGFQHQPAEQPVYVDEYALMTNETQQVQTARSTIRIHTEEDHAGRRQNSVRIAFMNNAAVVGGIDFYHNTASSNHSEAEQEDQFFAVSLNHTSRHTTGLGVYVTQAASNTIEMQTLPRRSNMPEPVDITAAQDTLASITTLLGIARTDLGV